MEVKRWYLKETQLPSGGSKSIGVIGIICTKCMHQFTIVHGYRGSERERERKATDISEISSRGGHLPIQQLFALWVFVHARAQ